MASTLVQFLKIEARSTEINNSIALLGGRGFSAAQDDSGYSDHYHRWAVLDVTSAGRSSRY